MGNKFGWEDDKLQDVAEVELDNLAATPATPDSSHVTVFSDSSEIYKVDSASNVRYVGEKLTVSSNDTTPDHLETKLVAGPGVTLTTQNDGGNETIKVEADSTNVIGLGIQREFMALGGNKWMNYGIKDIASNSTTPVFAYQVRLVGLEVSNESAAADTDFELWVAPYGDGTTATKVYTWAVRGYRTAIKTNMATVTINAGDKMAVYAKKAGGTAKNIIFIIHFQVTDTTEQELKESYSGNL